MQNKGEAVAMKVKDVMAVAVKTCREDSSLRAAAKIMWEQDIGCVPVVDHENHVVGILTDRDICMGAYLHAAPLTALSVTNAIPGKYYSAVQTTTTSHR